MADKSNSVQTIRRVTQTMPGRNADPQLAQHPADRYVRIMRELMNQKVQASLNTLDSLVDVNVPAPSNNQVLTWVAADAEWEAVTPAAGGDSTFTAAHASRPAPSNDGDLFFPNDGFVVERDTGAAWVPWGPIFPFVAPISGNFSWLNDDSGAATAATTKGGITLSEAAYAVGGHSAAIYQMTPPSTPYNVDWYILHQNITATADPWQMGIIFLDTVNTFGVAMQLRGGGNLEIAKYDGGTGTWGPTVNYQSTPTHLLNWFRMRDDGTNIKFFASGDGQNWTQVFTSLRHDFMVAGPDKVGVLIRPLDLSGINMADTIYANIQHVRVS